MAKGSGGTRSSSASAPSAMASGNGAPMTAVNRLLSSNDFPTESYNPSADLYETYVNALSQNPPSEKEAAKLANEYEKEYKRLDKERDADYVQQLHKSGLPTHEEYNRMKAAQRRELERKFGTNDLHNVINERSRELDDAASQKSYMRARKLEAMSAAMRTFAKNPSFKLR